MRELFQFLKDTMKAKPRNARSNYCNFFLLMREIAYPIIFQTSAMPLESGRIKKMFGRRNISFYVFPT